MSDNTKTELTESPGKYEHHQIEESVLDSPEGVLKAVQIERLRTVNYLKCIESTDPKISKIKAGILKDMSDQEISVQRLAIEADNAQSEKEIAQSIAEVSKSISNGSAGNPFARKVIGNELAKPEKVNRPDIKIPETALNKAPVKVTYDQFMAENYKED